MCFTKSITYKTKGATIKIMSKYRFTWTPGLRLGKGEWDGEEVYVSEFDIFKKKINWWEWLVLSLVLSGPLTQGGLKVFHSVPAVAVGIWRGSSGSRVQGADQGRDPTKMVNGKFLFPIFRPGAIKNRLKINIAMSIHPDKQRGFTRRATKPWLPRVWKILENHVSDQYWANC